VLVVQVVSEHFSHGHGEVVVVEVVAYYQQVLVEGLQEVLVLVRVQFGIPLGLEGCVLVEGECLERVPHPKAFRRVGLKHEEVLLKHCALDEKRTVV